MDQLAFWAVYHYIKSLKILKTKGAKIMQEIKIGRKYRHFKGKNYLVTNFATHRETGEKYVIYKDLSEKGEVYILPYETFAAEIDTEKYPKAKQKYCYEEITR